MHNFLGYAHCYTELVLVMHNFFGWGKCYSQSVLVTYIVAQHFFGYAYHQAQLLLVTHNNSCTNLFDYIHCYTPFLLMHIATHNFFWLGTMLFTIVWLHTSLHITFLLCIYIIAHILFCCAQRHAQHFLWLPTPSRTTFVGYAHCHTQFFLSCTTSCITLCWLLTLAEFSL